MGVDGLPRVLGPDPPAWAFQPTRPAAPDFNLRDPGCVCPLSNPHGSSPERGFPGAAHAELYGIDDPQDTSQGSDILALQVRNGQDNLNVTTYHENLRRDPATGSGGAIFVDTDKDDAGPEYVFVAGFTEGTDYQLLETEGFRAGSWGDPVEHGDYIMRVRYAKDRVHVRMSRAALGNPGAVRVAARASGLRTDGSGDQLVDWVSGRRAFTPWIARG